MPIIGVPLLSQAWYVILTQPNLEKKVVSRLRERLGMRAVHPRLQFGDGRPVSMFSRYCFLKIDHGDPWHLVRRQWGVSEVLGGVAPRPVREQLWLEGLVRRLDGDSVLQVDLRELGEEWFEPGEMGARGTAWTIPR